MESPELHQILTSLRAKLLRQNDLVKATIAHIEAIEKLTTKK